MTDATEATEETETDAFLVVERDDPDDEGPDYSTQDEDEHDADA